MEIENIVRTGSLQNLDVFTSATEGEEGYVFTPHYLFACYLAKAKYVDRLRCVSVCLYVRHFAH